MKMYHFKIKPTKRLFNMKGALQREIVEDVPPLVAVASCKLIALQVHFETNFIIDFLKVEFGASHLTAFLCCEKTEILKFTQNLFSSNYKVAIYDTYVGDFPKYEPSPDNVFVLDLDCFNSPEILDKAHEEKMLLTPYKWLLLTRNMENVKQMKNKLFKYDILVDSLIYLGLKLNDSAYSLSEIFKFYKGGPIHNRQLVVWMKDGGFGDYKGTVITNARRNLMGTLLKTAVVIVYNESYNHLWDYRRKHVDSLTKPNFLLMNILIEYVNGTKDFTYFKTWGYKNKTDKWYDGMIGEMQKDRIELSASSLYITKERIPDLDFLSLTLPTEIKFIFRQPPLSHVTNIFILPFSTTVWISLFGLVTLAVVVIYVVKSWEHKRGIARKKLEEVTVSDSVMVALGAVCQQGTIYEPMSDNGKTATEPLRKEIFDERLRFKTNRGFISLEEGIRRLRQGFYAFHCELPPAYTLISEQFLESEKCGLQTLQYVQAGQLWLPIKKRSPFREILKIGLQKFHEYGIQSRELNRLQDKKPKCLGTGNSYVSVGLVEATPAIVILAAGFSIALILFIFEHIVHCISTISK
ncbi:Ionotropic receptor 75d [Carabus blaptoides fortunei]